MWILEIMIAGLIVLGVAVLFTKPDVESNDAQS